MISGTRLTALLAAAAGLLAVNSDAADNSTVAAHPANPTIDVDGKTFPFRQGAIFVLPGQTVAIDTGATPESDLVLTASSGEVRRVAPRRWQWQVPKAPGDAVRIRLDDASGHAVIRINAFVLVPMAKLRNGHIGKFRVDDYPDSGGIDSPADYGLPAGFVRVSEDNLDLLVSPNFSLGQFLCKQQGGWPKYIVPGPRLYARLEQILTTVNQNGVSASTLTIMSGYRTPYYNKAIGNVRYSRHIYGDAADIFVDIDEDGFMDDLNRDGSIDHEDAVLLASWIDYPAEPEDVHAGDGGIGLYGAEAWRGPFVHIDTRGVHARWESL